MRDKVMTVLDSLRPTLEGEGGDLKLVNITDGGTVTIRLKGVCGTCIASLWTHRLRIERALKKELPDVTVIFKA